MKPWILYAFMTLMFWGLWGFCSKLASNYSRPRQTLLFQAVGCRRIRVGGARQLSAFMIQPTAAGFGWSFAAGFVNFMGFLAFFAAVEKGKVSTIISLSSLYPVITILLSVLLSA